MGPPKACGLFTSNAYYIFDIIDGKPIGIERLRINEKNRERIVALDKKYKSEIYKGARDSAYWADRFRNELSGHLSSGNGARDGRGSVGSGNLDSGSAGRDGGVSVSGGNSGQSEGKTKSIAFSRGGIFTGSAADYANRSRQGGVDDGPSVKHIGTGEGSQVYGWGLYGSTERGVADGYAEANKADRKYLLDGKSLPKFDFYNPRTAEQRAISAFRIADGDKAAARQILERATVDLQGNPRPTQMEALKWWDENADRLSSGSAHVYEQTWFTNRAEGDESHLLKWYEPVSKENAERVRAQLLKEFDWDLKNEQYLLDALKGADGGKFYGTIQDILVEKGDITHAESARAASEFLYRAGIDGVKYPVDSYGKTVKDGGKAGWNYVAFSDEHIRVDHKWTDGKIMFSRSGKAEEVEPSKLGDGKQRYYEVPFDKAVDKIVKNKKPVSDEHVFISETPAVFKDIGMPALPVMMNQSHVLSCYFGQGEGVKAGNMHGLGEKLKSLPKSISKPMMIIANESNPSSSVIAIVKMQDKNGNTVIAPVEINGIGRSNGGPITANIVKSAFGKKNIWSEKVAQALRDEVDGKVSVFYVDSNEARQISNRLAREAFHFGKSERQLLSVAKGTLHSLSDFGSPVKGVGVQTDSVPW